MSSVCRRGLTKRRWADSRTTGQGDCSDWPVVGPVGVIQTTAPSLPCLDVGKICIYCTKAYVDYYHTQTKTQHMSHEDIQNLNVCLDDGS